MRRIKETKKYLLYCSWLRKPRFFWKYRENILAEGGALYICFCFSELVLDWKYGRIFSEGKGIDEISPPSTQNGHGGGDESEPEPPMTEEAVVQGSIDWDSE